VLHQSNPTEGYGRDIAASATVSAADVFDMPISIPGFVDRDSIWPTFENHEYKTFMVAEEIRTIELPRKKRIR
jgi:hypothetical protein